MVALVELVFGLGLEHVVVQGAFHVFENLVHILALRLRTLELVKQVLDHLCLLLFVFEFYLVSSVGGLFAEFVRSSGRVLHQLVVLVLVVYSVGTNNYTYNQTPEK